MLHFAVRRTLAAIAVTLILVSRPAAAQETVLYTFTGVDGGNPRASLVQDSAGNLYGTACYGGNSNAGTVFKVSASGTVTVLYNFTGGVDGGGPGAGLVRDSAGNLYGTTTVGGSSNSGTVFKVDTTGEEAVLYSFTGGADGGIPEASVIRDSAGNLYGTTYQGGASTGGAGTVFKVDTTGKETVLYSFTGGVDGGFPEASLVRDSAGNLYGTTTVGGGSNYGTVFKVDTTGEETVLYSFMGGADGGAPWASLVRDSAGNLYGTTYDDGASGYGTVFKVDTTGEETVLYSFMGGADGEHPIAGLIRDSAGNLYGTTYWGGASNCGTVFKVDTTGKETVLYSFTGGTDGQGPYAGLVQNTAGNLYGTTYIGGAFTYGTVFEIESSSSLLELTPSYLVFPSAGSTLPLTVTNSGTAALDITVPQTFTGFNSFDFTVASGTTCTNGTMVAPGDSCTINVTFTPLTTSAESATLSLFDNASGSPQTVPLSGGAPLASVSPNPVPGSSAAQVITVTGIGFMEGAVLTWKDLTNGGTGTVTPLSVTLNELTASLNFTNATAAWQLQVANPGGPPSNWYSFEVLGSTDAYVDDDYPFQNANKKDADPYGFLFRECTSFVAWRMNRNAGTTNPSFPYFFNKMDNKLWGNANTWSTNAVSLGYVVDNAPQVGAIAQWVNDCGGACTDGHVAYVERVNQNGSIVVSEYNFPEEGTLNHQFNVRTISASSKIFPQNFIHVLSVKLNTNLLNFGNQAEDSTSSLSVTITNPTSAPVPVGGITITGTDKGDFAQTNTCGSSIPAGGSCQITVTFTPMGQGPRSAIVTVQDKVGPPIMQTITLMGSGT